jgi:NAD(P)-dependent dehydrogenase (short-subunit alcohol dehydrogenase family)
MFENKKVLITGGSSGIGLDLARLFLAEKAIVAIVASNPGKSVESDRRRFLK